MTDEVPPQAYVLSQLPSGQLLKRLAFTDDGNVIRGVARLQPERHDEWREALLAKCGEVAYAELLLLMLPEMWLSTPAADRAKVAAAIKHLLDPTKVTQPALSRSQEWVQMTKKDMLDHRYPRLGAWMREHVR